MQQVQQEQQAQQGQQVRQAQQAQQVQLAALQLLQDTHQNKPRVFDGVPQGSQYLSNSPSSLVTTYGSK